MSNLDSADVVKHLAAQAHHLDNGAREAFMLRVKEDFPEQYEEAKSRLLNLESPSSLPPRNTGGGGAMPTGRFGRAVKNFEYLMLTLKKNGVWAAVTVLLLVSLWLGYQLKESREDQHRLLGELVRMRMRRVGQNIHIGAGSHLERGAITKGGSSTSR